MRTVTQYVAFDGKVFDTAEACKAHEATNLPATLISLILPEGEEIEPADMIARINKALTREDRALADVLEKVGSEITKKRLADGEKKRNVAPRAPAPAVAGASPAPAADPTPAADEPPPPPAAERAFGRASGEA